MKHGVVSGVDGHGYFIVCIIVKV